jgi:hypothetical protein
VPPFATYDLGDPVTLAHTFSADPTTVTLEVRRPSGVWSTVAPTKVSPANYSHTFTPDVSGVWRWKWTGTGPGADVETGALVVRGDVVEAVVTPPTTDLLLDHEAKTAGAHGLPDPTTLVVTADARLSDRRVPVLGSVTDAEVAAANKDGTAATPSLRTLGTGTQQAARGNIAAGDLPASATGGLAAGTVGSQLAALDVEKVGVVPGLVTGGVTDNSAAVLIHATNNDVLRFPPGYYNLGGTVDVGPGKTILADGVRFKGGFKCTGGSMVVRGNHRYEPITTGGTGGLDLGVHVVDGVGVDIDGPTFDRTRIAVMNTTITDTPRRASIKDVSFIGDLGAWSVAQPLEVWGMGSLVVTGCHWDVLNAYRFAKLSSGSAYDGSTAPVGEHGYTRRLTFSGNVMYGTMNASNKQVIDCYAGVGESTFGDNVAIITGGTPEYWLEAKNSGSATDPTTARHNLSVVGGYIRGPFAQSVVKIQGALGETWESGEQVGSITGAILINTSTTADRMVVRMQQLHDASVVGCPKLALSTEGNFNVGVLIRRCRRAIVADNNLKLGGVFIGDEVASAKGQTQLVVVEGNVMDEPRYNGAITVWTMDAMKLVVNANIMRSASTTQPSVAALYVRDGTIAELTAVGNIADFAVAGTERIFLNTDGAITLRTELANSWQKVVGDFLRATPSAAANRGLVVKGQPSQAGNPFVYQDSADADKWWVTPTGQMVTVSNIIANGAGINAVFGAIGPASQAGLRVGSDVHLYRQGVDHLRTDDRLTAIGGVDTRVVATASLPVAGAAMDGHVLIEDAAVGDRNLIIYAGGQRFRIDGGAAF